MTKGTPVVAKAELRRPASVPPPPISLGRRAQFSLLRTDFLAYLALGRTVTDPIVRLEPLPFYRLYLVTDPLVAQEIGGPLSSSFHKSNQTRTMVGKFLGTGLVLSEDEHHHRDRKALSRLFARYFSKNDVTTAVTAAFYSHLVSCTEGEISDIEAFFEEVSFSAIVALMFGKAPVTRSLHQPLRCFAEAMAQRFRSMPLPDWMPTARNRAEKTSIQTVDQALDNAWTLLDGGHESFAADLAALYKKQDAQNGRALWRDQMKTMLFAGHETVARLMSWCMLYLAEDQDLQNQLRDGLLTETGSLPAFIQEVLRLKPPVWLFDRTPVHDTELRGLRLRRGDKIYISPWLFQRDPAWFADPEKFDPRRFLSSNGRENPAYMPFGLGARSCIGRQLAMTEAESLLTAILSSYTVTCPSPVSVREKTGATLGISAPVHIKLTKKYSTFS